MSGPKPLSGEAFAERHADKLNYDLVEVIEPRKFRVKCRSCKVIRVISSFRPQSASCVCTHKRKHYRVKLTLAEYNVQLKSSGYECLRLGADSKTSSVYRHSCGYEFSMSRSCFKLSGTPCAKCRPRNGYTHAQYARLSKARGLITLGQYTHVRTELKHRFEKCGHTQYVFPYRLTHKTELVRCDTCHPTGIWFRGKVQGKCFKVRSRVEIAFLKAMSQQGYDMNDVEYEPKDGKVSYFNPVRGRRAVYVPDFKVNDTYIELKDLASLGLRNYNWISKEEALIENRAKCKAAKAALGDYRIYVYSKGKFYLVHEFWKSAEQRRLLKL